MAGELFSIVARFAFGPIFPPVPAVIITNASGEGLHLEWDVHKTRSSSPDTATIVIYNMMPQNRAILSGLIARKATGRIRVELAIGWKGANIPASAGIPLTPADILFVGEDWRVTPAKQEGPDIVSVIEAGAGLQPLSTSVQGGAESKLAVDLIVAARLGQLKLKPSKTALAEIAAAATATGVLGIRHVWERPPRQDLDELMASLGLSWGVSSSTGEFVVYRAGLRNDVPPVILAPQSGLIMWAELESSGVEFEALAQPRLEPGGPVTFLDHLGVVIGGGQMRVEEVRFTGTTDGPSIMKGTARPVQVF